MPPPFKNTGCAPTMTPLEPSPCLSPYKISIIQKGTATMSPILTKLYLQQKKSVALKLISKSCDTASCTTSRVRDLHKILKNNLYTIAM